MITLDHDFRHFVIQARGLTDEVKSEVRASITSDYDVKWIEFDEKK